jgi:hypothetical protein
MTPPTNPQDGGAGEMVEAAQRLAGRMGATFVFGHGPHAGLAAAVAENVMVERVARAICDADGHIDWRDYVKQARAAIEAMRTPDEAMLDAWSTFSYWQGDADVKRGWAAAIDAALSPSPSQTGE